MPAVMTIPAPSPITDVQLTWTWPIMNPPLSVGSVIDRAWPPLLGQSRSIAPNSTSARPSVQMDWTSGPRAARRGPKISP